MFGFGDMKNFTYTISNSFTASIVDITNYRIASREVQQIIALNLTSSDVIGDHQVKI